MPETRVRFAPSPTGQLHIGNIRAAIFNWLYARHTGGCFLLRIEDTDRERSSAAAIDTILEALSWLGMDLDAETIFQSERAAAHTAAVARLVDAGHAEPVPGADGACAIIFRLPVADAGLAAVRDHGPVELDVHPDVPLTISRNGVAFARVSSKGKPVQHSASLAGFRELAVFERDSASPTWELEPELEAILGAGKQVSIPAPTRLRFLRREVVFEDVIKGELCKPLDSMKDLIIQRADGSPVFHLANVVDDIFQKVTHVIRGDDHVDNTYRHILLYHALDETPPTYAHLPMIVNSAGKPYSKRDGDAYVGEFREQGILPEALFNYLALLGWSPGDDVEMFSRDEAVQAFDLKRVKQAPAQMDPAKLLHMNGLYMAAMDPDRFEEQAWAAAAAEPWRAVVERGRFGQVATLMQSRTRRFADVQSWAYFFEDTVLYDEAAVAKRLQKDGVHDAIERLITELEGNPFDADSIEAAVHAATDACGIKQGKLNLPIRIAVTGTPIGAGLFEVMELLGSAPVIARLKHAAAHLCATP